MKYTSIFEKIACITEIIKNSNIYPIFLVILLLLSSLFFIKKIKNKKVIILMIISYLILFIITISNNYEALSKVFDSIESNLFTNIYFPSTYTYLFTLLVVDIVTITNILNIKTEKIYRIVNGLCFFIMNFILVLIMEVIAKNNVDIFSKTSLFSNVNLVILLETSIGIFILWTIVLSIIYISNKITERIIINNTNKELETSIITLPNTIEIEVSSNKELEEEYNKEDEIVIQVPNNEVISSIEPSNYNIPPYNNYTNVTNEQVTNNIIEIKKCDNISSVDTNTLFDKLLNNGLPIITEENNKTKTITNKISIEENKNIIKEEIKQEEKIKTETKVLVSESTKDEDNYTLNDYRIFNKILNDIKEFNNSNIITIDAYLELKLKAKYTAEKYYLFRKMLNNSTN